MIAARRRILRSTLYVLPLLALLAGCQSPERTSTSPAGSGGLYDPGRFNPEKLSTLGELWVKEPHAVVPLLFGGDFSSRTDENIAVVDGSRVQFYADNGRLLKSVELPAARFASGLVADVSQDGKSDLVLGGSRGNSARLLAVDADGHLLFDQSFKNMVRGTTRPAFYRDGSIYFTAHSEFNISPKMVGAFDIDEQKLKWSRDINQVPLGLSLGAGNLIAVSNRAVSRDAGGVPIASSSDGNRQAILIYDLSGKRVAYHPFGAAAKEGYFVKGQIASVSLKLADLGHTGTSEVLELLSRPSSIYEGHAEFRISSLDGTVEHRLDGPPRSGGNFGFYSVGSSSRLVIAWNTAGKLLVTDGGLEVLHERSLPGSIHETRLLQIGRFGGGRGVEYLVADANRLYVLDESLRVLFSTAFASSVRQAFFLRAADGRADLAVLAGRVHVFAAVGGKPTATLALYTNPPGAAVSIDGESLPTQQLPILRSLSPGEHDVVASVGGHSAHETVTLEPGMLTLRTLSIEGVGGSAAAIQNSQPRYMVQSPTVPAGSYADLRLLSHAAIPVGYRLAAAADFVGDPRKELLLVDRQRPRFLLYNAKLQLVGDHTYQGDASSLSVVKNLTGNKKAAILVWPSERKSAVLGYDGQGRLIFSKTFTNGYGSEINFEGWVGSEMVFRVLTGYMLAPRGFYLFDPATDRITSFSPMAGFITWVTEFGGKLYPDYYTPNNGARVMHPNGSVETDSKIYLDVFSRNGNWLPESRPLESPNPMGNATFIPFDADRDGKPELYFLVHKDPHYNTGRPGIYRFDGSAPPKPVLYGPMSSQLNLITLEIRGEEELAVYWRATNTLKLFGKDFDTLSTHSFHAPISLHFTNLDGDSHWERIRLRDGTATIVTVSGSPIRAFSLPNDTVEQVMTADLFQNGKKELILKGKRSIAIYGY